MAAAVFATLGASAALAAPIAVDDIVQGQPGQPVIGNVLANDTLAANATPTSVETVAAPFYGSFAGDGLPFGGLTPTGDFTYVPADGFTGVDVFAYRLRAGREVSTVATVFVAVGPVQLLSRPGSEPRLIDVALSTPSFANRTSVELADKADAPGQLFTVEPAGAGAVSWIAVAPSGSPALETWDPGSAGTDATVYSQNNRPWQQFVIEPTDRGTFTVQSVSTGFLLTADGLDAGDNVSAAPADGSPAQEWFLGAPNQAVAPLAVDDAFAADPANLDGVINGRVLTNDEGTGFDLGAFLASPPSNGELVGIGGLIYDGITPWGEFDYQPNPGFRGLDTFTYYSLTSGNGTPARVATVTIQVGDDAPIALDDAVATEADTAVSGNVLWNDYQGIPGAFFDPAAFAVVQPLNGQLTGIGTIYGGITPWGAFTYQPDPGFTGIDIFGYRVSTGSGASAIATVRVAVGPVRFAAAADPDLSIAATGTANRTPLQLDATADTSPQRWQPLRSVDFFPFNFRSLIDPGANKVVETWMPNAAGTMATLYQRNDHPWQRFDLIGTSDGAIEIQSRYTGFFLGAASLTAGAAVVAEPPLVDRTAQRWLLTAPDRQAPPFALDDVFETATDTLVAGNVLDNDTSNGADIGAFVATQPEHGALVGLYQSLYGGVAPWGAFEYQPAPGFTGVDSFSYYALGTATGTPSRLVTVRIVVGP